MVQCSIWSILPNFLSYPPTLPWKPFCLCTWPLLSQPVNPPPPPPSSLLIPSPSSSLLAAPPGRLIDSVPGGGDHATFLIWLPVLQIKATSLHFPTPLSSSPQSLIPFSFVFNLISLFLFFFFLQFNLRCLKCIKTQFSNLSLSMSLSVFLYLIQLAV